MQKFMIAFFMCWGNFLTLPCPYKRWDNKLKNLMLAMFPTVGAVVGVLWILLAEGLIYLGVPMWISAFILVFYIFRICGFMHLDGFMDVSDAIMSRRPLEERKRILKDSTVGAFAAVMAIFLIAGWIVTMGVFLVNAGGHIIKIMFMIPITSRACSAMWVLTFSPMDTSQYIDSAEDQGRGKCRVAVIIQFILWFVVTAALDGWSYIPELCIVTAGGIISSALMCSHGRRQLGGINGDIAGASSCVSEFIGVLVLACIEGGTVLPL